MADRIPPELDNEIKCVQEKGNHLIRAVQELSDEEILSSIGKVYLEGNFQCEILLLLNSPVRIKCLFLQNVYFFNKQHRLKQHQLVEWVRKQAAFAHKHGDYLFLTYNFSSFGSGEFGR